MSARASAFLVHFTAFVCGWVLMSLEILGGRILAPSFGSGVFTWGSLISTFLVALSLGYVLGGAMSRGEARLRVLAGVLAAAAAFVLVLPGVKDPLADAIFRRDLGDRLGPLVAALAMFAVPGLLLGMVSPYCVRLQTDRVDTSGATSGGLYAVSTVGSTAGTLVTTFYLIPTVGIHSILLGNGGALVLMAAILYVAGGLRRRASDRFSTMEVELDPGLAERAGVGLMVGLILLGGSLPARAAERVVFQRESQYSRISVVQSGSVRVMRFARRGVVAEESRVDVTDPLRQLNEYTGMMFAGLIFKPAPADALVIGLGGGVVPTGLRHYYPNLRIDCVELDPAVIDAARRFFSFRTDAGMTAVVSDGRVYVKRCRKRYDVVFLDAFLGTAIPFHLKTREFLEEIKGILKPGGVVVANIHRGPRLYDSDRATCQAAYPLTYAFAGTRSGNVILVSLPDGGRRWTRAELLAHATALQARKHFAFDVTVEARKWMERPDWDPHAAVLTDDYAPVEMLNEK